MKGSAQYGGPGYLRTPRPVEVVALATPFDNDAKFAQYAHPQRLVSTQWLAANLETPGLVVVESDEDVLLYETGHVPGAVKVDWHTELNDEVTRDYVDGARVRRARSRAQGHRPRRPPS